MATEKQKEAARKNIKKAQKKWKSMTSKQRAKAQPEGKDRTKPGSKGEGEFYHVEIRPKEQFKTFRTHDVGKKGHIERLAGKRASGTWDTVKWLISKNDARMQGDTLVGKTQSVKELISRFGSKIKHLKGDMFTAKPRKNVPESDKPTTAQRRARQKNIKKAQEARNV